MFGNWYRFEALSGPKLGFAGDGRASGIYCDPAANQAVGRCRTGNGHSIGVASRITYTTPLFFAEDSPCTTR
jgi:hypothetical protein